MFGQLLFFGTGTLLLCSTVFALDPAKSIYQYNCQNWTRQNGLPVNGILAITQTQDGYLWLGTHKGLVRFDGMSFSLVELPNRKPWRSQKVGSIAARARGGLWFGVEGGGFGSFDGEKIFDLPAVNQDNPQLGVNRIYESWDGSVWIASHSDVVHWNAQTTNSPFLNLGTIDFPIYEDRQHRVWFQPRDKNLQYWKSGKITEIPDTASTNGSLALAITMDGAGNLWVGASDGLRRYGPDLQLKDMPDPYSEIRALITDRDGAVWAGASDAGVVRYVNGQATWFSKTNGLADNFVTALYEDREGNIWVGTRQGLSQISDVKFPIFSSTEGIFPGAIHAVCPATNGGIWITTSLGLCNLNGGTTELYSSSAGFESAYLKRVFQAHNGDIYVANGRRSIEIVSNGKVIAHHSNGQWVGAFAEDSKGVIAAVGAELFRVDRSGMIPMTFKEAVPFYWIRDLFVSRDGSLLVGSVNGVFRIHNDHVQHWSTDDGLPGNEIVCITEDDEGTIWIGQPDGLCRIKDGKLTAVRNELVNAIINALVPDRLGNLWISTGRGIIRINRKTANDFADGKTPTIEGRIFDGLEAVKTIETSEAETVGCLDAKGYVWFPSAQGMIRIDPAHIPANDVAPLVHIQKVFANGKELSNTSAAKEPVEKGELDFRFGALSFIAPQKTQFRYKLEGYDQNWIEAGSRRSALYANLKPRKYIFHVQACNADGAWNPDGAHVDIELLPRIYQTAWFQTAAGLAFALGFLGSFRWRIRHLRRKEMKLQETNDLLESKIHERTQELAAQRNLLRTLIDNLPDQIFVKDTDGHVIIDNIAHARTLGVQTPDEAIGKTDFDCLPQEKAEQSRLAEQSLLHSGQEYNAEENITFRNGEARWLRTTKVPLRDNTGRIIGLAGIHRDITERKKAEAELESMHKQLLQTSRQAGMAEVATSVLHNVGNVLNSVNVSASIVEQQVRNSALERFNKLIVLLQENESDLAGFLTKDEKGTKIVSYMEALFKMLTLEKNKVREEIDSLTKNVEHIKKIVSMQQSYARVAGVVEVVSPAELLEDSLRMHEAGMHRHGIQVIREFSEVPKISVDRHKVIQILVNLMQNAKYACDANEAGNRIVRLQINRAGSDRIRIEVSDNGMGISKENLTRIFSYGFTTRKNGHGFGLHSGALAAKEMGGSLTVRSEGLGKGASFILELPIEDQSPSEKYLAGSSQN